MLLVASDPYLSSIRKSPKKSTCELTDDVMSLIILPINETEEKEEEEASDDNEEDRSEEDSDSSSDKNEENELPIVC
jgi:hypothetical protein